MSKLCEDKDAILRSQSLTSAGTTFTRPQILRKSSLLAVLTCVILCTAAFPGAAAAPETFTLDIPPRLQWEANYGYCGEVALISAGLYYGQYCSQYKARALATPGVSQSLSRSQLLVGVNAKTAATAMKLNGVEWNTKTQRTTADFLFWVKDKTMRGYPVIIGIFMNYYKFYNDKNTYSGDPDYDHIVPVTGVTATPGINSTSDIVSFSDNGLWAPNNTPPYTFQYNFGSFPKSRTAANAATAPVYSLNNNRRNYGIVVTGIMDTYKDTVPVRLSTSVNKEVPSMVEGSSTAPSPTSINITATMQLPNQAVAYNLYMYTDFGVVPTSQFNALASKASRKWVIPAVYGATYSVHLSILSNSVAVFRAVRTTAP